MRRIVIFAIALALGAAGTVTTGAAHPGHRRPQITVMRWQDPPVTVSAGECDDQGVCDEEVLILKAHDPDSSITEIQVWFDENGERAPIVFAHSFCLQGKKPGTPARMEIGASFTEPGEYVVAAVAHSHKRCGGHEPGDAHPALHSRITRLPTTVEPAS
jgi:hypothetical protein